MLNWLWEQLGSGAVGFFVGGFLQATLQGIWTRYRQQGKRRSWRGFLLKVRFIVPWYASDYKAMGGVLSVHDANAYAQLRLHLQNMGAKASDLVLDYTGPNPPSMSGNLISVGGSTANSVTKHLLDRINPSIKQVYDVATSRSYKVFALDELTGKTYHVEPDSPNHDDPFGSLVDYATVVRSNNPLDSSKHVLIISGLTGYGGWGAAQLLADDAFNRHRLWRSGQSMECLIKVTIAHGQPQLNEIIEIRPLMGTA